jgi:hypothetical protein
MGGHSKVEIKPPTEHETSVLNATVDAWKMQLDQEKGNR